MSGQLWSTNALGGYMWSPNLSRKLRTALQPMVRYRQFCDAKEAFGLGIGQTFNWNIYSNVAQGGGALAENQIMPETNFTITQNSATITEYGNSVPFTKKLDDLSEHPVTEIIHKVLKNDARVTLDMAAYNQFNATPIRVNSTSATTYVLQTTGTVSGTASSALSTSHVKALADYMAEANIPAFDGVNYLAVFRPTALRNLKNNLEGIHQYTPEGWHVIMNGERAVMRACVSSSRPTSLLWDGRIPTEASSLVPTRSQRSLRFQRKSEERSPPTTAGQGVLPGTQNWPSASRTRKSRVRAFCAGIVWLKRGMQS